MKIIDLAVIIPTLNEQAYIGRLLDSLAKQSVSPKEIIIVDAFSKDKTLEEIRKRRDVLPQSHYSQIPKKTISRQRNLGVEKTVSPYILFLDADMVFHDIHALETLFNTAREKEADFAIPKILPESSSKFDRFLYVLQNRIPKTLKPLKAFATTQCLFVTRDIFEKAGGFDEGIKVAEDFDLVTRMQKNGGKFVIVDDAIIYNSIRRLKKDGRFRFIGLLVISMLLILVVGYKKNPIQKKYDFGNHPKITPPTP